MITSAKGQSSPKNKIYTQLEAVIDLLSFLANTDKLFKDDLIMIFQTLRRTSSQTKVLLLISSKRVDPS